MKKNVNHDIKHCCDAMKYAVEDPFCHLYYNEKFREYWMRDHQSTSGIVVSFCFHCGTKLPGSLRKQWYNILENEYGLEYPSRDMRKVPKDFRSEAWWKKRKLKNVSSDDESGHVKRILGS